MNKSRHGKWVRRREAQNLQGSSRCRPLLGQSVTPLMSLLPSLVPQALKGGEFREGRQGQLLPSQDEHERGQAGYFSHHPLGAWEGLGRSQT